VDDTPANLQMLAGMLKDRGFRVRPVPSGKLALLAARRDPPDLILLDINMPEMNGYEVAKRMREQPALKNVMLVAITGYGQKSDRQCSQEAGFDHHLVKPADFGKLQQILATVSEPGPSEPAEAVPNP
jgi:CheY-like chemotaxis protein